MSRNPVLYVRTQLRAGAQCVDTDTPCIALNGVDKVLFDDDGASVWNNCTTPQPNAGKNCRDALAQSSMVCTLIITAARVEPANSRI